MSLLYENLLRETHSNRIQEWYQNIKDLLLGLEEMDDPSPEDIQLAFHLTQIIENFELMESNLVNRKRQKADDIDRLYTVRRTGSSVLFK
jgi:hypothetical protein